MFLFAGSSVFLIENHSWLFFIFKSLPVCCHCCYGRHLFINIVELVTFGHIMYARNLVLCASQTKPAPKSQNRICFPGGIFRLNPRIRKIPLEKYWLQMENSNSCYFPHNRICMKITNFQVLFGFRSE